jgi:hypothetical protein
MTPQINAQGLKIPYSKDLQNMQTFQVFVEILAVHKMPVAQKLVHFFLQQSANVAKCPFSCHFSLVTSQTKFCWTPWRSTAIRLFSIPESRLSALVYIFIFNACTLHVIFTMHITECCIKETVCHINHLSISNRRKWLQYLQSRLSAIFTEHTV